jgi:endogenous inhibitor of DNA gyrase (YacG/DUF329 family)
MTCECCSKEYEPKRKGPQGKRQKCCSRKCMGIMSRGLRKRVCKLCHNVFEGGKSHQEFCSKNCYDTYQRKYKGTIKKCLFCGKDFEIKSKTRKYCSKKCYLEYLLKEKYGGPSYNKNSINWFKEFDNFMNTGGRYATNGGEFYINDLRYFLDYINEDLKIIIEWDEERHYNKNGLKEEDLYRQNEIENKLIGFNFFRIREKEVDLTNLKKSVEIFSKNIGDLNE